VKLQPAPHPRALRPAGSSVVRELVPLALVLCVLSGAAFANPAGPAVFRGTVAFNQAGSLLQITNSPNAIINWQSFSIGAHEITRFVQQSSASAVLNRVTSGDPSLILGALQSNGRVFLVNCNGIVFGAGAQVDVGGLVASSLSLSNADFLAGRLRSTGATDSGPVLIETHSHFNAAPGGGVYLAGSAVTNGGIITSPRGEVMLAAGKSVELVFLVHSLFITYGSSPPPRAPVLDPLSRDLLPSPLMSAVCLAAAIQPAPGQNPGEPSAASCHGSQLSGFVLRKSFRASPQKE